MADTNLIYPYELEGGKKAVADEVMANFEAIQLVVAGINTEINNLTTVMTELKKKPTREMMDIYYSFSSQAPTGAFPLWTGETLTNAKTLYPQFWKKINQLASDGAVPSVATEEEYEEKVAKYGQCASFYINTLDGHVRLPKITQFISSIEQLTDIGEVEAGLPNITGNIWVGEDGTGWPDEARDSTQAGNDVSYVRKTKIFNASEYNELYGKSDTVQPQAVRLYLYLQVVNNATEISELNVSVIAEQLNNAITELEKVKNQYLKDLNNASEQALKGFKKETTNFYTKTEVDSKISSVGIDNKITNCITEIPQDIKLELNNGTLTLKAGSKVYIPNGAGKFDAVTVPVDFNFHSGTIGTATAKYMVFCNASGKFGIRCEPRFVVCSTTDPGTGYAVWYDTANNIIKGSNAMNGVWDLTLSLPVGVYQRISGNVTAINQVFNGFGYIGKRNYILPNVKLLISKGYNEDGSYKNQEYIVNNVLVSHNDFSANSIMFFRNNNRYQIYNISKNNYLGDLSSVPEVGSQFQWYYNTTDRMCYMHEQGQTTWTQIDYANVGENTATDTKFKEAFRAVDYNELEKRIGDIDSVLDSINGEVI